MTREVRSSQVIILRPGKIYLKSKEILNRRNMIKTPIFDKKNVLVLGGAGFIGSHLCDELVKEAKVVVIDNLISGQLSNLEDLLSNSNFIFIKADATQPIDLEKFPELERFKVKFQGFQEIYNLACPTIKSDFEKNVVATLRANSDLVFQSLEWTRKYQAKYLFVSSSVVYGSPLPDQPSFPEKYWGFLDHLSYRSAYNEGKRFAESVVWNYGLQFNLEVKIARLFNIYGPRLPLNAGRMISDFILAASANQDLLIYGDGTETDSYCYISDCIDGLMKFMVVNWKGVLNIGNPETCKIIDIAKKIITLINSSSKIVFKEPLPYLIKPGIPDISQAKERIGWFPMMKLDAGLKKTVNDVLAAKLIKKATV